MTTFYHNAVFYDDYEEKDDGDDDAEWLCDDDDDVVRSSSTGPRQPSNGLPGIQLLWLSWLLKSVQTWHNAIMLWWNIIVRASGSQAHRYTNRPSTRYNFNKVRMIIMIIITIIMIKTMLVMKMIVFMMFIKITDPQRRRSTKHPKHHGGREPDTSKVPHWHNGILQNVVLKAHC